MGRVVLGTGEHECSCSVAERSLAGQGQCQKKHFFIPPTITLGNFWLGQALGTGKSLPLGQGRGPV